MLHGLFEQRLVLKPRTGPLMQREKTRWLLLAQTTAQGFRQEVMIAVPLAFVVLNREKEILLLQVCEHCLPVPLAGKRIAELDRKTLQHRGRQQKAPDHLGLL